MGLFGFVVALLAIVSQVAVASVVWPDDAARARIAALETVSVVCQGGKPAGPAQAPVHRPVDPSLCPPAAAFAIPLAVMASGALLPLQRQALPLHADARAAIAAPPGAAPEAAFPRGPPFV
jgi:hypothetical protein